MTDTPIAEKTQATASTAADEGKHVAGVAQSEAAKVATEASAQVRSLAGEATTQVSEQVSDQTRQQRDRLVGTLGTLGDDLDQMADRSDGGLAADAAREVAAQARSFTSYLDGREPGQLLDDVRDFARRKPGTFLLGALVAGVVAGRVARGVKDAGSTPSPASPSSPSSPAMPVAAPTYDPPPPVTPVTPATTAQPAFEPPVGEPFPAHPGMDTPYPDRPGSLS